MKQQFIIVGIKAQNAPVYYAGFALEPSAELKDAKRFDSMESALYTANVFNSSNPSLTWWVKNA